MQLETDTLSITLRQRSRSDEFANKSFYDRILGTLLPSSSDSDDFEDDLEDDNLDGAARRRPRQYLKLDTMQIVDVNSSEANSDDRADSDQMEADADDSSSDSS